MILWENATFYSNDKNQIISRLLTDNGIIIAINDDCHNYKIDKVIDLKRNVLYPGFTDAHIHLIGYGRKLVTKNLNKEKNKEMVLKKIESCKNRDKIVFEGYVDIGITKHDLDEITDSVPIILRHNDYHSFTVNSYVLKKVFLESKTGILLEDDETSRVVPIFNEKSKEELLNMTLVAIKKLHKLGITNVHSDDLSYFNSYKETIDILDTITKKNPLRINMLIHNEIFLEHRKTFYDNYKYLKEIQVKMFYDGTLSSKTALLEKNYKNSTKNGNRIFSLKDMEERLIEIRNEKYGLAIHTIGDLALKEVIELLLKYPNKSSMKDRIVHASLASKEVIDKLKKMDVALDIQPLFVKSDKKILKENIEHKPLIYPFKEYLKNNILLNITSDAPVESPDPFINMKTLNFNRKDLIKGYTINPALTINENSGELKVGNYADFTVLSESISSIEKNKMNKKLVMMTVVDEKIVYRSKKW